MHASGSSALNGFLAELNIVDHCFFATVRFSQKRTTGLAIKIVEYTPEKKPTNRANANGRITPPPRRKSAKSTRMAVPVVIIVRLRVSLMLVLIIVSRLSRLILRMFSRTQIGRAHV